MCHGQFDQRWVGSDLPNGITAPETTSKALGALAVAQRDISRAQDCAREIVAALRRPRAFGPRARLALSSARGVD